MREQDKYSLWTLCKTLQYRKVFANAVVEETRIPLLYLWEVSKNYRFYADNPKIRKWCTTG